MLQHVFSVARRSLIVDCLGLCMPTFIGSMFRSDRVKYKLSTMVYNCLHGKAPSYLTDCCTPISQTLHHGVICVLPVVVNYSSLDTICPHMVVGLFLSRVRLPGTACATNCENRC